MKNDLITELSAYHSYHTKNVTRITHFIGIPAILFAILIFLGWIHISVPDIFSINLAWIAMAALLIYYFLLDIKLALGMTAILFILTLIANFISQPEITMTNFIIFLVFLFIGIIAQAVGHLYEKKKPAFIDNFSQLLIAPLYIFAEILFKLGYCKDLEAEIIRRTETGLSNFYA